MLSTSIARSRTIALRLGLVFGTVMGLFALALGVTFSTSRKLMDAEHEVATLDEAKHAGHQVASLIREQYIHQAHTIIEGDRSHLAHYEVAARQAREATRHLLSFGLTGRERMEADEIARIVVEVDAYFKREILPAVGPWTQGTSNGFTPATLGPSSS